jgi:chromosome segregation ATPase
MFERKRLAIEQRLAAANLAVEQAISARDAAQADSDRLAGQLPSFQTAVDQARAGAEPANAALAAAQQVVVQRQAERDNAAAARDAASRALAGHLNDEPPETLARDKPNPAYAAWNRKRRQLEEKVDAATATLEQAGQVLAQAEQARDGAAAAASLAAAAVTAAQSQLDGTRAALAAAQQRAADLTAAIDRPQQAAEALAGLAESLTARVARILAEPLDRQDLERAADLELADALAVRRQRHQLLGRRAGVAAARAALLAEHDRVVDDLTGLRAEIAAWPDVGRWPPLGGLVAAVDALVTEPTQQRARPARERDDDLRGAATGLASQLTVLQAVLTQAAAERDNAQATLAQVAADLAKHQEGP